MLSTVALGYTLKIKQQKYLKVTSFECVLVHDISNPRKNVFLPYFACLVAAHILLFMIEKHTLHVQK